MRLGLTINNIQTELALYTTTLVAMTAVNRGHEVWYIEVGDFELTGEDATLAMATQVPDHRYRSLETFLRTVKAASVVRHPLDLARLDVLWLRNDPSKDQFSRPWARTAAINFGRLARRSGVIVLNDPDGMMLGLDKLYMEYFPPEVRPRTLVSRHSQVIKNFIEEQEGWAVLKPLSGSGGHNVFLVRPQDAPNLNQMIEVITAEGYVIAQEYLPKATEGDIRLFLMNARPLRVHGHIAAIHRHREMKNGDMRSNMSAGARCYKASVTDRMLELAELIRPRLRQDGMFFVGLDIVGDKIMEINVQSPGGLHCAEEQEHSRFAAEVVDALERKVSYAMEQGRRFDPVELATSEGD